MNKQQLITVFSIATLVNGLGQEKISIIGSSVVINNFESKLNIYNKNYSDKNLQKYKGRIIIMVKNNYKENENIVLIANSTIMRHTLNITHLKLIRFIVDIESEEESAELIIKNSFKLSKDIHKNHLIETFSKDKKI